MSVSGDQSLWNGLCLIPASLLQYFTLTSMGWMLAEALHMHQQLISVFVQPETKFMMKRMILTWGALKILNISDV